MRDSTIAIPIRYRRVRAHRLRLSGIDLACTFAGPIGNRNRVLSTMTTTIPAASNTTTSQILSHNRVSHGFDTSFTSAKEKISQRGDLPHVSVERQLELLEQLAAFPLGRFLIENGGLNGEWTDVILMHPHTAQGPGLDAEGRSLTELEDFLFNHAPTVRATQERFNIFRAEVQERLHDGAVVASVPCGVMSDLLSLDYSGLKDISLVGADLDPDTLASARRASEAVAIGKSTRFVEGDAWALDLGAPVDLITSNGLNLYERDDDRVTDLYRKFHDNLKPGGVLVTSYLTFPPGQAVPTEWQMDKLDLAAAMQQRIVFVDVLAATWTAYRSTETTIAQLKEAGFVDIEVKSGEAGIFPTVIAKRPG